MGFAGYFVVLITILSFGLIGLAQTEQSRFTAYIDKGGVQKIDVLAGRYLFKPDYIVMKVNVPEDCRWFLLKL